MTLEERIELHEQWLRSMESNHSQFAEDLGRLEQHLERLGLHLANVQKAFADQIVTLVMNQAAFAGSQAKLAEDHVKLQQELRDLRDTVDRYIRFRGDGSQPSN